MSLSIFSNKKLSNDKVVDKFISKFTDTGNKVFSNLEFGTSNKVDHFEYIRSKRIFKGFTNNEIGIGNCGDCGVKVSEKNNTWFDCCNIQDKGICFDGTTFRDLTKQTTIIEEYKYHGWDFVNIDNCVLHFKRVIEAIPTLTDIHVYFDTTSMLLSDALIAKEALINWYTELKEIYPSYEGALYIIPIDINLSMQPYPEFNLINLAERWLRHCELSQLGCPYISTGPWGALAMLPPNYTNSSYVAPEDIIILSFIDECDPPDDLAGYHGLLFPSFGSAHPDDIMQVSSAYNYDLSTFLANRPLFTSYKQVLYPIVRTEGLQAEATKENVLQMIASIKARLLTPSEIIDLNASVDLSLLLTENPYTVPLEDYGVTGVWDKVSPTEMVFTSDAFNDELNKLLDLSVPVTQYTTDILPVKQFSEPTFTYDHRWDLFTENYKTCTNYDPLLPSLYKIAIK